MGKRDLEPNLFITHPFDTLNTMFYIAFAPNEKGKDNCNSPSTIFGKQAGEPKMQEVMKS